MLVLMLLLLSALCAVCALRTWHYGASSLDLVLMIVAGSAMAAVHFLIRHQHSGHAMHSMHESSPWGDLNGLLMHAGVTLAVAQAGLAVLAVAARRWMRTESAGSAAGPRIGPVRATLSAAGEGPRIRSGNTEGEAA
ncbi:hypothetical protein [Streptomyces acidicola]|uniref:hypothetical protein n=1 Tax=Streptomyces acidicola TaxID=2596892 RepID=UPI003818FEFB